MEHTPNRNNDQKVNKNIRLNFDRLPIVLLSDKMICCVRFKVHKDRKNQWLIMKKDIWTENNVLKNKKIELPLCTFFLNQHETTKNYEIDH